MIQSLINQYKALFDGAFGDSQSKKTVYNQNTDKEFAGNYRKKSFEDNIEYYKNLMQGKVLSTLIYTSQSLNIDYVSMGLNKRYAFKAAYCILTNNNNGYVEALEQHDKNKTYEKLRNAGKTRSNRRKLNSHKGVNHAE